MLKRICADFQRIDSSGHEIWEHARFVGQKSGLDESHRRDHRAQRHILATSVDVASAPVEFANAPPAAPQAAGKDDEAEGDMHANHVCVLQARAGHLRSRRVTVLFVLRRAGWVG